MIKVAVGFCLLSAILAASDMLLSDGQTKKIVSFAISLVFLVSLINLFSDVALDFDFLPENYELAKTSEVYSAVSTEIIEALLLDEDIDFEKIDVEANNNEQDGIIINKVTVYTNEENKQKAQEVIHSKTTAVAVEVICD